MDKEPTEDPSSDQPKRGGPARMAGPGLLIPLVIVAFLAAYLLIANSGPKRTEISYSFFTQQLRAKNVLEVKIGSKLGYGRFKTPPVLPPEPPAADSKGGQRPGPGKAASDEPKKAQEHFVVTLPNRVQDNPEFMTLLEESGATVEFPVEVDPTVSVFAVGTLITIVLFVLFWLWLRRQQSQMMGGGFLSGFG